MNQNIVLGKKRIALINMLIAIAIFLDKDIIIKNKIPNPRKGIPRNKITYLEYGYFSINCHKYDCPGPVKKKKQIDPKIIKTSKAIKVFILSLGYIKYS